MEFIIMDGALFDLLIEKLNNLVGKVSKINSGKDAVLEKWLDNQEVCEIIGISKSTLQTLRDTGKLLTRAIYIGIFRQHKRCSYV